MLKLLISLILILGCSDALAATQLKKTVCPSGCDYTTLESCMNTNEQNLVTADKYFDVEISGTWSSADTTAVTIHNYTTDATRYINIYTTGSARHDGTAYKNGAYNLKVLGSNITISSYQDVTVDGLIIEKDNAADGVSSRSGITVNAFDGDVIIKNNIIFMVTAKFTYRYCGIRILAGDSNCSALIYNNIIYGFRTTFTDKCNGIEYSTGAISIYNNTVYNNDGTGIISTSATVKNNISYNNGTDYSLTTSTTSNNLSKDASSPDTLYRSKTLTFTNTTAGSENLHLASTDTDAINMGADLGSPYNVDIDGNSRPQGSAWDIGADEYVSTAVNGGSILRGGSYINGGSILR